MSPSERREMIRQDNTDLSLTRQCTLLKISRSSIYYTPVGFDQATIDLMHKIDRIFTKYPFVNAELKFPRSAEVKFPTFTGPVISRFQ